MFKIEVTGNLGSDAQIKCENGRKWVQFSVADTRRFKKEDGTVEEITNWVSCFMSNVESAVIPFLKRGTKVYARGSGDLRLFSSKKDRRMKPGVSINVSEIELLGSSSDPVPRELAAETGELFDVQKYFWVNVENCTLKPNVLYDKRGLSYLINEQGFVTPLTADAPSEETIVQTEEQPAADDVPFT